MGSKTPAIRGSLARSEVTSTLIDKVNVELFASCIAAAPIETAPFARNDLPHYRWIPTTSCVLYI